MCNRTDCAGVFAGELACRVCNSARLNNLNFKEINMDKGDIGPAHSTPCIICNNSQADEITLHYTSDGWDTPFRVCLCRNHQSALIGPVQEAVRKMREEREVKSEAA